MKRFSKVMLIAGRAPRAVLARGAIRRWLTKVSSNESRAARGRMRLSVLLGLLVPFLFLLGTTPARAGSTAVTTCGQILSAAGDYELTNDLGPCQGDGVVIAASGVHLTLGGHTISGVNPPSVCDFRTTTAKQVGVRAQGPFTNVRINGGSLSAARSNSTTAIAITKSTNILCSTVAGS